MNYNKKGYIVRISENALIHMVLNGLEAYSVLHECKNCKSNNLETYGQVWGHVNILPNGKTLYCVEMMTVDTSANRTKNSVEPNDDALILKKDIMSSFWPQYEFLGDFHTHPYKKYNEVIEKRLYNFSKEDIKSIEDYSEDWIKHKYRLGIVLSIAGMKKKGSKCPDWINNSTIEFTLGNYRFWLKGYITYLDESNMLKVNDHDDENIILDCPAVVGLIDEYSKFGRLVSEPRSIYHKSGEI